MRGGFTLVEAILATTILAFATFGVLGLLRLSDHMSYRAKVDAKASQLLRARVGVLEGLPFTKLRFLMASYAPDSGNSYVFERGVLPVTGNNPTQGFPFLDDADPFDGLYSSPLYFLSGKALPSGTGERSFFPYMENVTLIFSGPPSSASTGQVQVVYTLSWLDQFSEGSPAKMLQFVFTKYDTTQL